MAGIATSIPGIKKRNFSSIKDSDEKRFMAEDAARTMKRFAEVKREIKQIKADGPLFTAARAILTQEAADIKQGMKS
jgi:hypothetical protein